MRFPILQEWMLRVALIGVAMLATTGIMELALRAMSFEGRFANDAVAPYPQHYFRPDETSGFDLAENVRPTIFPLMEYRRMYNRSFQVWSNELGCFDRPYEVQNSPVLLVGDSFAWGYVPFEQGWGSILERETATRVLKCGVGGYGTRQEGLKIESLLKKGIRPHLIVLAYFVGNDLTDDYLFPHYTIIDGQLVTKVRLDQRTGKRTVFAQSDLQAKVDAYQATTHTSIGQIKDAFAQHSEVYNLLRRVDLLRHLMAALGKAEPVTAAQSPVAPVFRSVDQLMWLDQAWAEHLQNLKGIYALINRSAARMVLVIIPTREQIHMATRPSQKDALWDLPNQKLAEFCTREKIDCFDLKQGLQDYVHQHPGIDLYWRHDGHWNVKGNHVAGLLVSQYLLDRNLLGATDRLERLHDINMRLQLD